MYIGLLEDEPHLAQHVCAILQTAGHTTSLFNNGADMVKAVGRDTIDLFILDWRVPRMSGLEVLKHIRNVRGLKEPVLFLTSRTDEQDIVEALKQVQMITAPSLYAPKNSWHASRHCYGAPTLSTTTATPLAPYWVMHSTSLTTRLGLKISKSRCLKKNSSSLCFFSITMSEPSPENV